MGGDLRDLDNDGRPDLVVSGILNDSFLLFRNLGARQGFEEYAQRTGLLLGTRQLTGWSLGMYDFDNDGWKDLFVSRGDVLSVPLPNTEVNQHNSVFRNSGGDSR